MATKKTKPTAAEAWRMLPAKPRRCVMLDLDKAARTIVRRCPLGACRGCRDERDALRAAIAVLREAGHG